MMTQIFFVWTFFLLIVQSLCAKPAIEQLKDTGYIKIYDKNYTAAMFDSLYVYFDEFITFLQENPVWAQKLYGAKERFIRSHGRNYYSTDFFGFYDESQRERRHQVAFYYCTHFHEFICAHYPAINQVVEIARFFKACFEIQKPCAGLCGNVVAELGLETIFPSYHSQLPILLKVIKYLPAYIETRPHYDGSALSLFLDSTDNQSLLLSPYTSSLSSDDFSFPTRNLSHGDNQRSIILIPGAFLTEFSIYPTPHIVVQSNKVRYATIAFAMRPNYIPGKTTFSPLPYFNR